MPGPVRPYGKSAISLLPDRCLNFLLIETLPVLVEKAGSYNRAVELLSEEPSSPTNTSSADLVSKLHDSEVVRQFLLNTPGQLTAHGLTKLSEVIPPFGIAVLFRHNHFATIYKQASNELYLLCTDIG